MLPAGILGVRGESMNGHMCIICFGTKLVVRMECIRCGSHLVPDMLCPLKNTSLRECQEPKGLYEETCICEAKI